MAAYSELSISRAYSKANAASSSCSLRPSNTPIFTQASVIRGSVSMALDIYAWAVGRSFSSKASAPIVFQDKALAVLWAVMLATPELRPVQVMALKMGHRLLMSILKKTLGHLDDAKLKTIATTIYRASYAMLYAACQDPDEDKTATLEELKRLQNAYLRSYITGN